MASSFNGSSAAVCRTISAASARSAVDAIEGTRNRGIHAIEDAIRAGAAGHRASAAGARNSALRSILATGGTVPVWTSVVTLAAI